MTRSMRIAREIIIGGYLIRFMVTSMIYVPHPRASTVVREIQVSVFPKEGERFDENSGYIKKRTVSAAEVRQFLNLCGSRDRIVHFCCGMPRST